jgi:hypothetical protein
MQSTLTAANWLAVINISDNVNATIVRFLRIWIQPVFLLTVLNGILIYAMGDADSTGGPFLSMMMFVFSPRYINQLNTFLQDSVSIFVSQVQS